MPAKRVMRVLSLLFIMPKGIQDAKVFNNIYVLTNENSASCSKLVTLGLKTYLDNVTVIGKRTYGKGVGQLVYKDKIIFLSFNDIN